jgi:CMP/dCMP kinase
MTTSPPPIVTIDGPAAAGKGTLARRVAAALGLPYLDTGLLYRAVGRRVLDNGGNPADPSAAEAAAKTLRPADLDRSDLRGPQADAAASAVAAIPAVRAALLAFQRDFAAQGGAVLDGRDTGTVIFPNAAAKIFVTADLDVRARRRWLELRQKSETVDLVAIQNDMRQRDARDSSRTTAPLRPAPDAFQLDTTTLDAESAFQAAISYVRTRIPLP